MSVFHQNGQVTLLEGDVREQIRTLAADSVQCVVTSPPYWSLRDYGVAPSIWWSADCDGHAESGEACCCNGGEHLWQSKETAEGYQGTARWQHSSNGRGEDAPDEKKLRVNREERPEAWGQVGRGDTCRRCGAWRGALGLEPTPEMFIAHTVDVFREVRRVLRQDGTLWLNIGDSYATQVGKGNNVPQTKWAANSYPEAAPHRSIAIEGMKPKDLVGIPWMLAFALRADGWYLRQEIIWHKPNPMPESVTDRCTKAHESLFLLAKSRRYFYDADAIREPASGWKDSRFEDGKNAAIHSDVGRKRRTVRPGIDTRGGGQGAGVMEFPTDNRNKRSVWSIPTAPFPEAHFATFPPALVEPCILAGSKPGDLVLDPFIGSGTTAMVARNLGRRAIGIDLNPEYLAMAVERIGGQLSLVEPSA